MHVLSTYTAHNVQVVQLACNSPEAFNVSVNESPKILLTYAYPFN